MIENRGTSVSTSVAIALLACIAITSIIAVPSKSPPKSGLPMADRQLVIYRDRLSIHVALVIPQRQYLGISNESSRQVRIESQRVAMFNSSWGEIDYWLKLPGFNVNLFWPTSVIFLLLACGRIKGRHKEVASGFVSNPASSSHVR